MSFETGKIGRQADGAVVASSGDTIVYSTACYQKEESEVDFTPLRVDYFARFRYRLTDMSQRLLGCLHGVPNACHSCHEIARREKLSARSQNEIVVVMIMKFLSLD